MISLLKKLMLTVLCVFTLSTAVFAEEDSSSWNISSALPTRVQNFSFGGIGDAVKQYEPVLEIVKKTWDAQSLRDIIDGKIKVPDEAVNAAIAQQIAGDDSVKSLSITSKENGRLEIHADTKKIGRVELSGTVDAFVHNSDASYVTYTIKERELKDHSVMSWIFSRISLSMTEKLIGPIKLSNDLPTTVKGNSLTIDYSPILKKSLLSQASLYGCNLLDALQIEGAVPHDGYIEFQTALNVPDIVKTLLLTVVL